MFSSKVAKTKKDIVEETAAEEEKSKKNFSKFAWMRWKIF